MSFTFVVIAALCFCSAMALLYSKYLSLQAYIQVSESQKTIDALDVQWSQLQIEESTFSEYGRVERAARDRLDMAFPALDGTVMIVR
ncbi:cell division protein FtsL [Granulosicoccus antarcticus]|nr:cell division protein FtsL [Granulosicoccus antarcticus]